MSNFYDNLQVDINSKHIEFNNDKNIGSKIKNKRNFLRSWLDKILFYFGIYKKLIDSGFYRSWFEEFNDYWTNCLGGRPLKLHDFFFLHSWYRMKYQNVGLKSDFTNIEFIQEWQRPENIYSIFGSVYRYALSPFQYFLFRKYLKRGCKILEYGSGVAPITSSLINDGKDSYNFTIADIKQFTFHYAKWRLRQFGVHFLDLSPEKLPEFSSKFDVIFINEVLEHLPNPLDVLSNLTNYLNDNGCLIFDYVISDATGMDTPQGLEQREKILKFIENNYSIEMGKINYHESMDRTVARKK